MSHINEKIDFTVSAYIVYEDKVLLRMHEKYHVWCGVGGHVELHENPVEAVLREIEEECGVAVEIKQYEPREMNNGKMQTELTPPDRMDIHYTDAAHQHVNMVYFLEALSNKIQPHEDEAEVEIRWCVLDDLETMGLDGQIKDLCVSAIQKFKNLPE